MNKKITFWVIAALTLTTALYATARSLIAFSGLDNSTNLETVVIIPSPRFANRDAIISVLSISKTPSSIYDYNLKDMQKRVMEIPEIRSAVIKRRPSGRLYVTIAEAEPVAIWFDGQNYFPMTKGGEVINRRLERRPAQGLVFSGLRPKDTITVIRAFNRFPDIASRTDRIEFIEGRRWNLYTQAGTKIMLPEGDLSAALSRLDDLKVMNRKARLIDLRDGNRALVTP
ncbi:MAG: cell division protein FtsQ/DivIB [Alphaproteobacteria bacterium]|nr:cell division protein FtsQ/DivIB [Alphaproteobacteria bacterium]